MYRHIHEAMQGGAVYCIIAYRILISENNDDGKVKVCNKQTDCW
jgi:hypothetical protein